MFEWGKPVIRKELQPSYSIKEYFFSQVVKSKDFEVHKVYHVAVAAQPHELWEVSCASAVVTQPTGGSRRSGYSSCFMRGRVRFSWVAALLHFNCSVEIWWILTSTQVLGAFRTFSSCMVWKVTLLQLVHYWLVSNNKAMRKMFNIMIHERSMSVTQRHKVHETHISLRMSSYHRFLLLHSSNSYSNHVSIQATNPRRKSFRI